MMKKIITKELKKYRTIFKELATSTGFIARKVKITAQSFVGALTSVSDKEIISDEIICSKMQEDYNVDISRQALNKRLHDKKSVNFLKKVTEKLLENRYKPTDEVIKGLLEPFNNTYIYQ